VEEVCRGHLHRDLPEGSHDGRDHQNHFGVVVGNHRSADELLAESVHNDHGHHNPHNGVLVAGFCHGNLPHGVGCNRGHGDGHNQTGMNGVDLENGSELCYHGEYPVGSVCVSRNGRKKDFDTYVCNTCDANAFEFTAVKLFYCSFEISSSLELNKTPVIVSIRILSLTGVHLPFAITVTAGFGVNNVKARLTGEVFEVLYPESM
jgi:hypothetical protein